MDAVITTLLTALAHLSKIIVGFVFLKVLALQLGAEGMGWMGNFMSLVSAVFLIAGGGILNGVIKYTAIYKGNLENLYMFWREAKTYSVLFSLFICMVLLLFSKEISLFIFGSNGHSVFVVLLGIVQFGYAAHNLIIGGLNGLQKTKQFAVIQILGNACILPVSWVLVKGYGVDGALLSSMLFYLMCGVFSVAFFLRSDTRQLLAGWVWRARLGRYSIMSIVGAISFPLVEIFIRDGLISSDGYRAAGLWQASLRISGAYMGFVIVFMSVFFLPKIAGEKSQCIIKAHVQKGMLLVMLAFLFGGGVLYLFRDFFVITFLSDDFMGLSEYLHFQLVGDFFRASAYVIGFLVISHGSLKLYIASEVAQGGVLLLLFYMFMHTSPGIDSAFLAGMIVNMLYFAGLVAGFLYYLKGGLGREPEC